MKPQAAQLLLEGPEKFAAASRRDLEAARLRIAQLKGAQGLAVLEAYDDATAFLGDASSRASVAKNAHPDPALRAVAEKCEQEAEALATEVSLDPSVYQALSRLDLRAEDEATQFYLARILRDFRRAGVDRDEPTRLQVRELNDELVRLGQEFARNIREDLRSVSLEPSALRGLPDDYLRGHPVVDGRVRITTDTPDYVPFMSYAESSAAREELWRVYRQRAHPKNEPVLRALLERRHQLARLLKHDSWAAYVTEDKMIGSAQAAAAFIAKISDASQSRAAADYGALLARKRQDEPSAVRVEAWDAEQLKVRIRTEQHDFDSQAVRPYFEFQRVQAGLLALSEQLFGLQLRRATAKVWHPDVSSWDVFEGEILVGRFYLDLFPREGKYKHAAQFSLAGGQAGKRLPEAALLCNFSRPGEGEGGEPALLEHAEVVTFFHEFGHLLHHLLGGRTRWAGLSGVRTEWDFVEAPSQMLEEWCWDPDVLRRFARHLQTNEAIPVELVERMKAAEEFGKGLRVRQQMFYAAVSLGLHDRDPALLDIPGLAARLQEQYTPFRFVEDTWFHESFGHLEGYSAVYYTYMWSLVIAKDLFGAFAREGLLNPGPAGRYRRAILEPGGSKKAADLVRDFLGRESNFEAYAAWLDKG